MILICFVRLQVLERFCAGVFAKTCYDAITQRMEAMSEEEVANYSYEVQNDTGVTIDEAWSRKLTNEEVIRLSELEREYYGQGYICQNRQ